MNLQITRSQLLWALLVGLVFAVAAWALSKQMRRAYRADVIVMMAESAESTSLAGLANQFGGVAALLGSSFAPAERLNEALATLRSRRVVVEFLRANDRLAQLQKDLGHHSSEPREPEDELNSMVSFFRRRVLAVAEDRRQGTIRVSITWFDRKLAAEWANEFVAVANRLMRERAINDAQRSTQFLKSAVESAESVELRQAIFRLMEAQIKSEMVATTRPEFALRIIDPAVPSSPDGHVRPKSALLGAAAGVFGTLSALFAFLLLNAWRNRSPASGTASP